MWRMGHRQERGDGGGVGIGFGPHHRRSGIHRIEPRVRTSCFRRRDSYCRLAPPPGPRWAWTTGRLAGRSQTLADERHRTRNVGRRPEIGPSLCGHSSGCRNGYRPITLRGQSSRPRERRGYNGAPRRIDPGRMCTRPPRALLVACSSTGKANGKQRENGIIP